MTNGGLLPRSARMALQRIPWLALKLAVVSTRAEPLLRKPPRARWLSVEKAAIGPVAMTTVSPGATAIELDDASLRGAPPEGPNTSTPTVTVEPSVFVQLNTVER